MQSSDLKSALGRLGLNQRDFARLIGVSQRTVGLWASGEQALPGPVAGYLRLLEQTSPEARARELRRIGSPVCALEEGIYQVSYRGAGRKAAPESEMAVAVLRAGRIAGADAHGGVFKGSYEFDPATATNSVRLRVEVPPDGMLVTGYLAGAKGASVEVTGAFKHPSPAARAVVHVDGHPVEIGLNYLGPLPS